MTAGRLPLTIWFLSIDTHIDRMAIAKDRCPGNQNRSLVLDQDRFAVGPLTHGQARMDGGPNLRYYSCPSRCLARIS